MALEEEHVEHAKKLHLQKAKLRIQARRKRQAQKLAKKAKRNLRRRKLPPYKNKPAPKAPKVEKPVETRALNADEFIAGKSKCEHG